MNFEKYYINPTLQADNEFPFEIVGEYRAGSGKYKIELDYTFSLSLYYCLGGRWRVSCSGTYTVLENNKVQFNYKEKYKDDDFLFFDCDSNGRLGLNNNPSSSTRGYNNFSKSDFPNVYICTDDSLYPKALKKGNKYYVIEEKLDLFRVVGENKKIRWYPKECFITL